MLTALQIAVAVTPFVVFGVVAARHFWVEGRKSDLVHDAEVDALIDDVGSAHPHARRGAITGLDDSGGFPTWEA